MPLKPKSLLIDVTNYTQTREEILRVSMAQNRVDASVNFTAITAELEGFTGSDIKEVPHPSTALDARRRCNDPALPDRNIGCIAYQSRVATPS